MDWRETMQRMLTRMEETDRWPAICDEARAVLSLANDATREPAAYLWGGCLWRTDEMGRGRPGAVELYRAQTPMTDAEIVGDALNELVDAGWLLRDAQAPSFQQRACVRYRVTPKANAIANAKNR